MEVDNSLEIKKLNKKLPQINERISAQRMLDRKKDTRDKSSLGKVFLLCGLDDICSDVNFTHSQVIIIGALAKKLNLHLVKISHFLGACAIMIKRCQSDSNFRKKCTGLGDRFFEGEDKLKKPFNLIMGILLEAKAYLTDTINQTSAHKIGDIIFEEFKDKRAQERIQKSLNHHEVYYV